MKPRSMVAASSAVAGHPANDSRCAHAAGTAAGPETAMGVPGVSAPTDSSASMSSAMQAPAMNEKRSDAIRQLLLIEQPHAEQRAQQAVTPAGSRARFQPLRRHAIQRPRRQRRRQDRAALHRVHHFPAERCPAAGDPPLGIDANQLPVRAGVEQRRARIELTAGDQAADQRLFAAHHVERQALGAGPGAIE